MQPISIRLPEQTIQRLQERARHSDTTPRTLAQRYVEEGLRMDQHPLIRFVDGPGGRRARVVGTGADVWEVIATVKDNDGDVDATAEYLGMSRGLVDASVDYYGAYAQEVDGWITRNDVETRAAHQAWEAGRAAIRR